MVDRDLCSLWLQALCVNDSVLKLGSLSRINERCLEMLQSKPTKKQAIGEPKKQKVAVRPIPILTRAWAC